MLRALLAQADDNGINAGVAWALILITLAWGVLVIAGWWKVFTKAGEAGWKAIIPIFNFYIVLKIVGRPGWWLILMLIPFVNIIVFIIVLSDLAKSFGKGLGFTVGLVLLLPVFALILGFGEAQYRGPAALGFTGGPTARTA